MSNNDEFTKKEYTTNKTNNKTINLDDAADWNILGIALIWIFLFITYF